jgi:hypothetical protein
MNYQTEIEKYIKLYSESVVLLETLLAKSHAKLEMIKSRPYHDEFLIKIWTGMAEDEKRILEDSRKELQMWENRKLEAELAVA